MQVQDDISTMTNPVQLVVAAAHSDKLAQEVLENANVVFPSLENAMVSKEDLLVHMADLIADAWPDPSTTDELQSILSVAMENLEVTTSSSQVEPICENFDQEDDSNPLPALLDAPPNASFRCESVKSGTDTVRASKAKSLCLLFFPRVWQFGHKVNRGQLYTQ